VSPSGSATALKAVCAIALIAAAGVHIHHLLTGYQAFWVSVTLLMTVFCFSSSVLLMGGAATLVFFGLGVVLGFFFESLSIRTGFPFGPYYYTDIFGPRVLGVPYIIPLAWYVIVYLSYVLANLMVERRPVAAVNVRESLLLSMIGAAIVTAYDLALDPFMVRKIGAWVMINPGNYFGEQFRGFAGWMLVAFSISALFRAVHRRIASAPPGRVTVVAAAYPLLAYAGWWAFFTLAGYPPGTRPIAAIAMGIPVLAALAGLARWRGELS
jgi:uncharacterized membrane protein